ncbi:hypothetical protein BN946_scf184267.g1 [Trametes cinnabarina]|uniref:Uncharacterized protein n=1 Tax=Pycnoporus cinnabarinus TaxID=5643 RepID=A0A060SZ88_PYCCI|nr:hypothetical protein BN946_scf184267.g1 [Trametes cinnabarina]
MPTVSRPVSPIISVRDDPPMVGDRRLLPVLDYYYHLSGLPFLPPPPPLSLSASLVWAVPHLRAPWNEEIELNTYILHEARLTIGGRTDTGTAIVILDPPRCLLPPIQERPDDTAPGGPDHHAPAVRASTPTPEHTPPDLTAAVGSITVTEPPRPRTARASRWDVPPPPSPPVSLSKLLNRRSPSPSHATHSPTQEPTHSIAEVTPCNSTAPTLESDAGESAAARHALSDAVDEAIKRLEGFKTHPRPTELKPVAPKSPLGDTPRVVTLEEVNGLGELQYPSTDEEVDELLDSVPGSPPKTPPTPSPRVSPHQSPYTSPRPPSNSPAPYNLRPRPRPLPRRFRLNNPGSCFARLRRQASSTDKHLGTIKKPRKFMNMHLGDGAPERPDLALPPVERNGLNSVLDVPARLWTKHERRFLRTVTHSLRRAAGGRIGYGEPASANDGMDLD